MLVKLWMKKIIFLCLMINKFLNGMNIFIESISKINPENQQVYTSFLSSSVDDENIILVRTNITIANKLQIFKNLIIE